MPYRSQRLGKTGDALNAEMASYAEARLGTKN